MRNPLRVVTTALLLVVEMLLLAFSPIALVVAAGVGIATRSTRPPRSVLLVASYLALELRTTAQIARGVEDWDELVRDTLHRGYRALTCTLDLDVALEEDSATPEQVHGCPGIVVLARHSGPGDSVLIAWLLSVHYKLRLRVVLKAALKWEPLLAVASPHLPLCFVHRGSKRAIAGVRRTASDLRADDCLLMFPEGGNFSWQRREEAIRWLTEHGHLAKAIRARRRTYTLPIRTRGAIAALQAAPDAAVLLVTHSGMSPDGRSRPWWRLPVHLRVDMRTLLVPPSAVPRNEAGIADFLDRAWEIVDTWVESRAELDGYMRGSG